EAIPGYQIQVYTTQFGSIPATGQLDEKSNYFVGQVPISGNQCPSVRVAVGFDPVDTEPPTAEASQTFCQQATVADLVASGTYLNTQTIRWYRTETDIDPLPVTTQLIDNETYWATQIVNNRAQPGSLFPPCESALRTAVTVTVEGGT